MASTFNIFLGTDIRLTKKLIVDLDSTNGIFIIGRSGSGKSTLITWLLTQLALKNVKIILAEYGAHTAKQGQTLIERTQHLHGALIQKPMSYGKDINAMIRWLKEELDRRQNGAATYPLVVVIDEFYQYASDEQEKKVTTRVTGNKRSAEGETKSTVKENSVFTEINAILTDARKNNIRFIFATQEPKASRSNSTDLRTMRDLLGIVYLLQSSDNVAQTMGVYNTDERRLVDKIPAGVLWNKHDGFVRLPNPIPVEFIDAVKMKYGNSVGYNTPMNNAPLITKEPVTYDWTKEDEEMYMAALYKYGPKINQWIVETKEDLIRVLVTIGKNNHWIKSNIKGKAIDLDTIANSFRKE